MNIVRQFIARPVTNHLVAVKRIMRYLRGQHDVKLCLGDDSIVVTRCCNANYARDTNDRISTPSYIFEVIRGGFME